jgi:hypothetical protein
MRSCYGSAALLGITSRLGQMPEPATMAQASLPALAKQAEIDHHHHRNH